MSAEVTSRHHRVIERVAHAPPGSGDDWPGTAPVRVLCVTAFSDRPEAETFIGLHRQGFDITVMSEPSAPHFERIRAAGIPVVPLTITRRFDRDAVRAIRGEIERRQPEILHLFNNKAVLNGLRAARGRPLKIIAYRGIAGNDSYLSPTSWLRYLNPRVDRIVCVADAVRRHFLGLRLGPLRMDPRKPVRIYKGHDLDWYRAAPLSRAELGLPNDALVIGCVANWRPRKGIEVLVEAFAQLPEQPTFHLLLVGRMDGARLKAQIAAHPHRARIHLLGYRDDAPAVIAACDMAVLPSLKREGLPKTVIEAMAYGVPPIVTATGGSPELIEDGVSGLVVPAGDAAALAAALRRIGLDAALRAQMGEAARERIATAFPITATIEQTAALYHELVG